MFQIGISTKSKDHPVIIGEGALENLSAHLPLICQNKNLAVITDKNVWNIHGAKMQALLESGGYDYLVLALEPGESTKSLDTLKTVFNGLAEFGLRRDGTLIAFGGGVVGDVAGFAAATYMRGIPYIQVPTTLLAQVDSSVGGKVAVNLDGVKNLIGSFYQPSLVLADTSLLHTLPKREYMSGMAEVVKYAAIGNTNLLSMLLDKNSYDMEAMIALCIRSKAYLVWQDELDTSVRMLLNFGHTFAHAIEMHKGNGVYSHGEAVAAGMLLAIETGIKLGETECGTYDSFAGLLDAAGVDIVKGFEMDAVIDIMENDKKNKGENITLVLLKRIGEPYLREMGLNELKKLFAES